MTNLLEKSSDWLEQQRTKHAASTVKYVRGGRSVEVLASIGKTTFEVDDGYGVLVRHESRDFLTIGRGFGIGWSTGAARAWRSDPGNAGQPDLCVRSHGSRQRTVLAL